MHEAEDGFDLVEWISEQTWYDGTIVSCGSSYVGQTQWCLATHPLMTAIAPEVSGLGVVANSVHLYMFLNAYARVVGKGRSKLPIPITEMERHFLSDTMAGGFFNAPISPPVPGPLLTVYPELRGLPVSQAHRRLWEIYCSLSGKERADFVKQAFGIKQITTMDVEKMPLLFGQAISHDALTVPCTEKAALARSIGAPPLLITGWYDWALNDTLATWDLLRREGGDHVRENVRLLITPSAHNMPGYHEGVSQHPELQHNHRTPNNVDLLMHWYGAIHDGATGDWPRAIYYLMGANRWCCGSDWPPPNAKKLALYLAPDGMLRDQAPIGDVDADIYDYDPCNPTPTVGGSIVSYLYPPGSVDVSGVQRRPDVLTYTTAPLPSDLDVVGPLRMILHVSSSAVDTDFVVRLSDVFPDGRAIQLQGGHLRTRFRNMQGEPELLVPGQAYKLDVDMWATANRFRAGHRLRIDISSSDFPRHDRNANLGGFDGEAVVARQTIFRNVARPSHVLLSVLLGG
jgi:predicted acyl esterase